MSHERSTPRHHLTRKAGECKNEPAINWVAGSLSIVCESSRLACISEKVIMIVDIFSF